MNIKEGPAIREFAAIRGIPVKEVLDWANTYVNHPGEFYCDTEKTVEERLESIKGYIKMRLDTSINARIRKQIEDRK